MVRARTETCPHCQRTFRQLGCHIYKCPENPNKNNPTKRGKKQTANNSNAGRTLLRDLLTRIVMDDELWNH